MFQNEKEYLQPLPNERIIDSYLSHDRQTTVRKDFLVTFNKCKYSVPAEYIGKPVRLQFRNDTLYIYHSTELIASHSLSEKRLNYHHDHYVQLLARCISNDDMISEVAAKNLEQLDKLL